MKLNRKFILTELRDFLLLAAVGTGLSALSMLNKQLNPQEMIRIATMTSIAWIVMWKGNSYIADYLDSRLSWIRVPLKRFLVGLSATLIYTALVILLIGVVYSGFDDDLRTSFVISLVITVIISLFLHGRSFLMNWKKKTLEAEKYHRETITAKYETLKNQVNPHFLFNSLNALTNLVHEDKDKASLFIRQLAEVYRYVLDAKDKEVVSLGEELHFLKSYLFLQQIRFGKRLSVVFEIRDERIQVAPLTLQMLIENAIKHNIVSEADPLVITIAEEGDSIVVRNNLQLRTSIGSTSTGVGLENISRRYESLGRGRVEVVSDPNFFIVRIPVLREVQPIQYPVK
jgi:sensor histidine kinase YesM